MKLLTTTAFLNLALLIIGATATLSAFGGSTWREGNDPLLQRINRRGWLSLSCLLLALAIGIKKEIRTEEQDTQTRALSDQQQQKLSKELGDSRLRLDRAYDALSNLHLQLNDSQERLNEQKKSMNDLRQSVTSAREDLSGQRNANLITAMASSDQRVKDVTFFLPLTSAARTAEDAIETLLPKFNVESCRDLTGLEVLVLTQDSNVQRFTYRAGDKSKEHNNPEQSFPNADMVEHQETSGDIELFNAVNAILGQKSWNKYVYMAEVYTLHHLDSAATLYAALSAPDSHPVAIRVQWPTSFATKDDYEKAIEKYPSSIKPIAPESIPLTDVEPQPLRDNSYPAACAKQVKRYFETAFDKAMLIITLNQPQNESIAFKLKALTPRLDHGVWEVEFATFGSPDFSASDSF